MAGAVLAAATMLSGLSIQPAASQPPPPVLVGKWNLEVWTYGWQASETPFHPWVEFKPDGAMEISDGCYQYKSHYALKGQWLTIDQPNRTGGGCVLGDDRLAKAMTEFFTKSLAGTGLAGTGAQQFKFAVNGDTFTFRAANAGPPAAPTPGVVTGETRLIRQSDFRGSIAGAAEECATPSISNGFYKGVTIACMADGRRLSACKPVGTIDPILTQFAACIPRKVGVLPNVQGPVSFNLNLTRPE